MFQVTTVYDTIRIPPNLLRLPTIQALEQEIDAKFPNRVLLNVGLVICRYISGNDSCIHILQSGACVAGDAGAHVSCRFQLLVFAPAIDEICIGRVASQSAHGVVVSVGDFFDDSNAVFIPAYWMLNPSHYEEESQLWIWSPEYKDDIDRVEGGEGDAKDNEATNEFDVADEMIVKEELVEHYEIDNAGAVDNDDEQQQQQEEEDEVTPTRYEMSIGSEIRFRVKYIQYTQTTRTAKGVQSTTTSSSAGRKRSTSIGYQHDVHNNAMGGDHLNADYSNGTNNNTPPTMQIVASICEDGLGLTYWWAAPADDDEDALGDEEHAEVDEQEMEDMKPVIKQENGF